VTLQTPVGQDESVIRVLYDHQIFRVQTYGGISRYFVELIPRVAQMRGLSVSVFLGFYRNRYGLESRRNEFANFRGFAWPKFRGSTRLVGGLSNVWLRHCARRWQPQLYHPTNYEDPLPQFRGKRVITVYDLASHRLPELFGGHRFPSKAQVDRADGIICISATTKRDLMEFLGVGEHRIAVIPLANALKSAPGERSPVAEPYVLFVGRRPGYKNFNALLRAMGTAAGLRRKVHLVCFGTDPWSAEEEAIIEELGLREYVHVVRGGDELLATLYAHAGAFVFPSLYEGFGIPLLEAMHYRCPVVASDIAIMREVAAEAAVYFQPNAPEDLGRAIEQVLSDTQKRRQIIEAGALREATFSWDRAAAATMAFYQRVVRGLEYRGRGS
jgi:glycosyltransferase involved in cell wall biosynthesis